MIYGYGGKSRLKPDSLPCEMTLELTQLPFDILYLIVQQACGASPLTYGTIDSATLQSVSLVSKSLRQVATPFLYSSITLSTRQSVQSLGTTAKENPLLLKSCHSLLFSEGAVTHDDVRDEQDILSSASALRRFVLRGLKWNTELILPSQGSILELGYPDQLFYTFRVSTLHSFVNLERLILGSIPCFHTSDIVDVLTSMVRLAYIAVSKFTPEQMYDFDSRTASTVARLVLTHATLKRTVWGLIPGFSQLASIHAMSSFHQSVLVFLPDENDRAKVVFLSYGIGRRGMGWFSERVADGTIWQVEK
jgi:hypothetical protein